MGQVASRQVAKQVRRAAAVRRYSTSLPAATTAADNNNKPPRPPPLGRPVADAPDVIEDPTKALKERQLKETQELLGNDPAPPQEPKQQQQAPPAAGSGPPAPPQPDQNSGFYRGQISDPRDTAQEQFLKHQSGEESKQQSQQTPELAPDLLKFLQDVGPLEKKVNKEMTSTRILNELEEGKEKEKMQQLEAEANLRNRDEMRLVENIDGFSTPRTTNFFSTSLLEEEEADFGLTDLELYDLLKRAKDEAPAAENTAKTYHEEKLAKDNNNKNNESNVWTEEDKQQQQQLLRDAIKYLELPIIVKDSDMNYLGVPQAELDKEFAHQKIDVVDDSRVKLVLADLHDLGQKEVRRIR